MYTIGEISKIVNISANALRYYDEIGLIKPKHIQDENQYRMYSDEQVADILFILELKQYGFSLGQIKELVLDKDGVKVTKAFKKRLKELEYDIEKTKEVKKLLEMRLIEVRRENVTMSRGRIMIVDDVALVRITIRNIVEKYGYSVIGEAMNGKEAVEKYEQLHPDIVIMGICMPLMDGLCATAKIREKCSDAKVIMCSSMSQLTMVIESLNAGAVDFISKPFSTQRLIDSIIRASEGKSLLNPASIWLITNAARAHWKEKSEILLKQDEIDTLLSRVICSDPEDDLVKEFFNSILPSKDRPDSDNTYIHLRSSMVERDKVLELHRLFNNSAGVLSEYFSGFCNETCSVKVLVVETMLTSDFWAINKKPIALGILEYEVEKEPVIAHISLEIEKLLLNTQMPHINALSILHDVLERFTNIVGNVLNDILNLPNNVKNQTGLELEKLLSSIYPIVVISLEVKTKEESGMINVSIPHELLKKQ